MSEATRILSALKDGNARAAEELLPLVNERLHCFAQRRGAKSFSEIRRLSGAGRPQIER